MLYKGEKGNYAIKNPSVSAGYGKWYARNVTGTSLSFGYTTEPVAYFPRKEVGFVGGAFTEGDYTWHQIKRIHGFASESDAGTIRIAGDLDISRGDMFSSPNEKPTTDNQFEATVCWMSEKISLTAGSMLRIKHTTHTVRALILGVDFKVDVNNLSGQHVGDELVINEIGQVSMKTTEPLIFDEFVDNRTTGSFILIDATTNETVGAGMIGRPTCFATV